MATRTTPRKTTRSRRSPGAGSGNFYRVEVRPRDDFVTFRTQDVGGKGHIERVAGQRASGSWATVAWLIGKQDAHVSGRKLVPDTPDARKLLQKLGSEPVRRSGDRFEAMERPRSSTRSKTAAPRKRTSRTVKKTTGARRSR